VTPSDGKADGKPVLSAPVKILNTPPVIQEVWIEPKIAYAHDSLKAIVKSDDRDGDMVYVTYRWEKNGLNLNDERGERIRPGQFKKGDVIIVEITPDDRETSGTPKKSPPLIISNTPPQIVSNPQISVEGSIYTYQVKAIDPDQDPVAFTLKSGPKGMEINKKTGLIRWDIRKEDRGVHSIEIEGSDPEGAKCIQQYKLTIEFK
jgi:hypothetical protein